MPPRNSLPTGGRAREEIAQQEVGHTQVGPAVARSLVGFFVAAVGVVMVMEIAAAVRLPDTGGHAWSRLLELPRKVRVAFGAEASGVTALWPAVLAGNRAALASLAAFEDALEDESWLGRTTRPRAQRALSGWLGSGNERVYIGRDGWLFYAPDVDYVTGSPFLDETRMRRRVASGSEWAAPPQPDPRPAILDLHRQLRDRGIALVVVPTPVKPAIHPEKLGSVRAAARVPLHNPSFDVLLAALERDGVLVFDPARVLADARTADPQYLARDTHWRPEAMELVAERLAAFIRARVQMPRVPEFRFGTDDREVASVGDTAAMLDLPAAQRLYPPERVWIRRVIGEDGAPWQSAADADVLVLGDSFSNIYSLASMGWGDGAGFVEQLSHALARPLDRIVQNDAGAHATRERLARAGPARLEGKRLVVWQFATRELAFGDWRFVDLPR